MANCPFHDARVVTNAAYPALRPFSLHQLFLLRRAKHFHIKPRILKNGVRFLTLHCARFIKLVRADDKSSGDLCIILDQERNKYSLYSTPREAFDTYAFAYLSPISTLAPRVLR